MIRDLLGQLQDEQEIELTVTGRKTGRPLPRPVWFGLENRSLLLLPQYGPTTQWYKNIMKDPKVRISVRGSDFAASIVPILDQRRVLHVIGLFTAKYGKGEIDKYYTNMTVAAEVMLT